MPNKPENPAEWARFCAEQVMGWKRATSHPREEINTWCTEDVLGSRPWNWSPYEYLTDAREVLEELSHATGPKGPYKRRWRIDKRDDSYYTVALLDVLPVQPVAFTPGPHEGPAICELAWKIKGNSK